MVEKRKVDDRKNTKVIFVLADNVEVEAARALNYASGFLQDFLKTLPADQAEVKVPLKGFKSTKSVDFLNTFINHLDTHLHGELRCHFDETHFWIKKLVRVLKKTLICFTL